MEESSKSKIVIEFTSPGSAVFSLSFENVIPMQLVVAGDYLRHRGLSLLDLQESKLAEMQERDRLVVPDSSVMVAKK